MCVCVCVCAYTYIYAHMLLLQLCPILQDPRDCTCQAPLSLGFSRQEYYSGLPCPPPRDLSDPGIELVSPTMQANSLLLSRRGSLYI